MYTRRVKQRTTVDTWNGKSRAVIVSQRRFKLSASTWHSLQPSVISFRQRWKKRWSKKKRRGEKWLLSPPWCIVVSKSSQRWYTLDPNVLTDRVVTDSYGATPSLVVFTRWKWATAHLEEVVDKSFDDWLSVRRVELAFLFIGTFFESLSSSLEIFPSSFSFFLSIFASVSQFLYRRCSLSVPVRKIVAFA